MFLTINRLFFLKKFLWYTTLMNTTNTIYYIEQISKQLFLTYNDKHLCDNYAWNLLEKLCNKTKTKLIIAQNLILTPEQKTELDEWIFLLTHKKMPIQYILGSVPFDELNILVEPPILIPRPETEEWCINIVNQLKQLHNKNLTILDLATGSGCIALTLAHHFPHSEIIATDISTTALKLAQNNCMHNNIHNLLLIESDLFEKIPTSKKCDIIVANPPYIAESEKKDMDESVTLWEDNNALFALDNGLAIIKNIIDQAPRYIQHNAEMKQYNIPQIVIEIGYQQGHAVEQYMISAHYNDVQIYKDLEKKDRVVVGRIDNVANSNAL